MSHPDAALYIQVPIFDTTVAVHSTVKVVLRKGLQAELGRLRQYYSRSR